MADPFNIHKGQGGFPGRENKLINRVRKDGQAVGIIVSEGPYSDRTRTYIARVNINGSTTLQIAKSMGVEGSGVVPRYQPGDRVALQFPNTGATNQVLINGPVHEIIGARLPEVAEAIEGENALTQHPDFAANPSANMLNLAEDALVLVGKEIYKDLTDLPKVVDNSNSDSGVSDSPKQKETAIKEEAESFVEESKEQVARTNSLFDPRSGKFLDKRTRLITHNTLDEMAAKQTLRKAELELEEAEEDRRRQEEMNRCLEKRNKEIEEGLEQLQEKIEQAALEALNEFLPGFMQISAGKNGGISVGPFKYNPNTGKVTVAGEDNLGYVAANAGLSLLNQSLPPYLQLCLTKTGVLEVGDYGRFDIDSILEGEPKFDIGPFSMEKNCQLRPAGPGASEEVCSSTVSINGSVASLANNALDELNQGLPEPLHVGFNNEKNKLSVGPVNVDLGSGNVNLNKGKLASVVNQNSKRFFPSPLNLRVSSDFESVSLGPVTYNSEDKSISVLGETIFIQEGKCKKDKAQSQPALTESPQENKKANDAAKSSLPSRPRLSKFPRSRPGSGEGRGASQSCNGQEILENLFDPDIGRRDRDAFRFDTFLESFLDNLFAQNNGYKQYGSPNVGLEAGIITDGETDYLSQVARDLPPGYEVTSYPTVDIPSSALEDLPPSDLAALLASYGIFYAGQLSQALHDLIRHDSILALMDFLAAVGSGTVETVSYNIKADISGFEPAEIVNTRICCEGLQEWLDLVTPPEEGVSSPLNQSSTNSSPPSSEEVLDYPFSLLDWATEVDPENRGIYQSLKQGAVTDAMTELIYQNTGRNIDALGTEYERLRSAVARATFASPRGHDLQEMISIDDLPQKEMAKRSSQPQQPTEEKAEPLVKNLQIIDPYPGEQTELKTGDEVTFRVLANEPIQTVEIQDSGALFAEEKSVNGTSFFFTSRVNAEGTQSLTYKSARFRFYSANRSQTFTLEDFGIDRLRLNDLTPTFSSVNVTYPNNQEAIKCDQTAGLELQARDYSDIEVSSNGLTIDRNNNLSFDLSPKSNCSNLSKGDFNVSVKLRRAANDSQSEKLIEVSVDQETLEIEAITNNEFKSDPEGVRQPINIKFSEPISNLELDSSLPVGESISIEGEDRNWRHTIEFDIDDPPSDEERTYQVKATNMANEVSTHTVNFKITDYLPYSVTIDTRQTLEFTVPEPIQTAFGGFQLFWIYNKKPLSEVSEFSGAFQYRRIDNETFELSPDFQYQYVYGETTFLVETSQ
jgi:hypothetical protein